MAWRKRVRELLVLKLTTSESNTSTGSGRLVHLSEDESDLGFAIELNDRCLLHFMVQIVTLTSTFADTSEDRETTVGFGDVILNQVSYRLLTVNKRLETYNEFLNEHSLADTSSTEQTNLSTTSVWGEKVDDLDTGDKNFSRGGLFNELGGIGVDRELLCALDGSTLVNWISSDIHDTTEGSWADGNHDGGASIGCGLTTDKTFGTYGDSVRVYEWIDGILR
jgi:hypothetical protein